MPGNPPEIIRLFRIVHWQNVEYILRNGIYTNQSPNADPNYIHIGDTQIITQRRDYPVKITGCGNLGDYIPFYFAGHSPMLLNIKTGFRGIMKRPQRDIVYIVCKMDEIVARCNEWIFTDGHAKDYLSNHYDDLKSLDMIDWDIVSEQYWKNTEDDFDRQRRKQAEFLVRDHVPVDCIEMIVVKKTSKKEFIEEIIRKLELNINVAVDTKNRLYYHD